MKRSVKRWKLLIAGAGLMAVCVAWGLSGFGPFKLPFGSPSRLESAKPPAQSAAPGTGTSEPQDLFRIMAQAPAVQPGKYRLTDLPEVFPAFQHAPFDRAGFNAVLMPFSYSDPDHLGNSNESLALSAMISNDLDWSPGSYCARHAFFVFKRDRDAIQSLMHGYDSSAVAAMIGRWSATHAIGGELIRTGDGYKGALQIFDRQGKSAFVKRYEIAEPFWNLLGDMDVAAMTFLDAKPAPPLVEYLHQPRCARFESVAELGSAALLPERSQEEFETYGRILAADPGFALVRHWYANQKHWQDRDDRAWAEQDAMALASRIEPASLAEFSPENCPDPNLATRLPEFLDRAAAVASADSPLVISGRLRHHCLGVQPVDELIDRGLKVAARYPNSHDLVLQLSLSVKDYLLQASLLSTCLLDRYMPGTGVKTDELYDLCWSCNRIERTDVAMELLSAMGPKQPQSHLALLLESLSCAGRYSEAADLYPLLDFHAVSRNARMEAAPSVAFAAYMTHNQTLLDQVLQDQSDVLAAAGLDDIFKSYDKCLQGKSIATEADTSGTAARRFWRLLQVANSDALHGVSVHHHLALELMFDLPITRELWMIEDNYERRDPSRDAGAFYDYLEMFFPQDPWAASAVADFHKRGGSAQLIDPQLLLADIKQFARANHTGVDFNRTDWQRIPTVWCVAACVRHLLDQHRTRDAAEIAQTFLNAVSNMGNPFQITVAAELLRRTKQVPVK